MHTDSYTRKKTWIVASHGLEIPLESTWEIEVKFNTQFGSKSIGYHILKVFSQVSRKKDENRLFHCFRRTQRSYNCM